MEKKVKLFLLVFVILFSSCSYTVLTPTGFEWPLEEVLKVSGQNEIFSKRYSLKINVSKILEEEILLNQENEIELRIIRDVLGYYYLTGAGFKNVYVLEEDIASMIVFNRIKVSGFGLEKPAFNQRSPWIELYHSGGSSLMLNSKGTKGDLR